MSSTFPFCEALNKTKFFFIILFFCFGVSARDQKSHGLKLNVPDTTLRNIVIFYTMIDFSHWKCK